MPDRMGDTRSTETPVTRIRATCPSCGEVDLRPDDVVLELVRDALDEVVEGSCYRFDCPSCEGEVTKPADSRIARLLTTGGVEVVESGPVVEPHPENPPAGAPLGFDDLLAFHQLLARDDWFADVEGLLR